jgi:hypothetical protein
MFSYYGSKCKIAKLYPAPVYDTIIEPFAGAAWYSLLYNDRKVILNDKYETIYGIWDWLIHSATEEEILANKDFLVGFDISNLNIAQQHKDLLGFCINRASTSPKNIVQKWSCQVASRPDWASTTSHSMVRAARLLSKIKHWRVSDLSYEDLPDIEATWFIDPIYQYGGNLYVENKINYNHLRDWVMSRKGQVVCCENMSATWMDFKPLIQITGQRKKTTEAIWLNY